MTMHNEPRHNYYITFAGGEVKIVGPFNSIDALAAHGEAWEEANDDDLRWHSIHIKPDSTSFIEWADGEGFVIPIIVP